MSYLLKKSERSLSEKIFLILFLPSVVIFYTYLKWPDAMVRYGLLGDVQDLYFFGKHPGFWYGTLYTLLVCGIALKVLLNPGRSPYNPMKGRALNRYQRGKFSFILFSQSVVYYFLPLVLPALLREGSFWSDPVSPLNKNAFIYVSRGFTSWGGFAYIFVVVPVVVWFFGKRYCSWWCSCGNLAETIGVTAWGNRWVREHTPTGRTANRMQYLQNILLALGIVYGVILLIDLAKVFSSPTLLSAGLAYQEFAVDYIFGALVGVGFYPFFGTRIWCRYGCPLAKLMELVGRYGRSRYRVKANGNCRGLNLCSSQCPMGIDVASFAHKDKKPILGSFGLNNTLCIGCGGCVDRCPTNALEFVNPLSEEAKRLAQTSPRTPVV